MAVLRTCVCVCVCVRARACDGAGAEEKIVIETKGMERYDSK